MSVWIVSWGRLTSHPGCIAAVSAPDPHPDLSRVLRRTLTQDLLLHNCSGGILRRLDLICLESALFWLDLYWKLSMRQKYTLDRTEVQPKHTHVYIQGLFRSNNPPPGMWGEKWWNWGALWEKHAVVTVGLWGGIATRFTIMLLGAK